MVFHQGGVIIIFRRDALSVHCPSLSEALILKIIFSGGNISIGYLSGMGDFRPAVFKILHIIRELYLIGKSTPALRMNRKRSSDHMTSVYPPLYAIETHNFISHDSTVQDW